MMRKYLLMCLVVSTFSSFSISVDAEDGARDQTKSGAKEAWGGIKKGSKEAWGEFKSGANEAAKEVKKGSTGMWQSIKDLFK